jgi:hypothetical protein
VAVSLEAVVLFSAGFSVDVDGFVLSLFSDSSAFLRDAEG